MVKRYKRLTYIFENAIEVYEYLDGKYGAPGNPRKKRKKITPEQIEQRNQWNKERKARHKLRTWMKTNDYLADLTYKVSNRPRDMKEAKEHFKKAIRYIRREYKKRGQPLRWLRNIECGTKNGWHVHLVVNRIPDTDIILKEAWRHGRVYSQLLYEKGEFAELAEYITKTPKTCTRIKEASYSSSRNMPVEEPKEQRFIRWKKEPKPKENFYIDKDSYHEGINERTGYRYRYYTMIRINRRI